MFGYKAKEKILSKKEAYDLARELGIHLSEHGGTGDGVIGALAGTGLRLGGNDGRSRGKLKIDTLHSTFCVREILSKYPVDLVQSIEGQILEDEDIVQIGDWVKTVLLAGKCVLLVYCDKDDKAGNSCWKTCTKQQIKKY